MHEPSATVFAQESADALANPQLRRNFRRAMDGLMAKRRDQFPVPEDTESLRELARRIRKNALRKLPDLLEQLEANCQQNGIQVHWAETVEDANRIVLMIAQRHQARSFVKGKSMVTEEMELNHFLEAHGIECLESDLGEYIVQLNQELPSHIIMPAIHLNKGQISDLFQEKGVSPERTESADEMTALAREVLRRKFHDAHLGISGVNFAVAETGTLCLVENEGNGRFCTTLPPVHIALMGIEKVVERLEEVPPLLSLLTRSATGQPITTYFNMITSNRKAGELDGPQEVHLVLLDNGRSQMYQDDLLQDTLMCIRCGACLNHCPVYARIGGHAYRSVYPGPIGKILAPQMKGLQQAGHLASASSLCGACVEVCPVKIPITNILLKLREQKSAAGLRESATSAKGLKARTELWLWKGWAQIFSHPGLYRLKAKAITRMGNAVPANAPILKAWTSVRSKPSFAPKSLHELTQDAGIPDA
jgi:L-lactate dehydrogenase complex protein LldF